MKSAKKQETSKISDINPLFFGKRTLKFIALVMTFFVASFAVPHVSLWGLGGTVDKNNDSELIASAFALLSLANFGTGVAEAQGTDAGCTNQGGNCKILPTTNNINAMWQRYVCNSNTVSNYICERTDPDVKGCQSCITTNSEKWCQDGTTGYCAFSNEPCVRGTDVTVAADCAGKVGDETPSGSACSSSNCGACTTVQCGSTAGCTVSGSTCVTSSGGQTQTNSVTIQQIPNPPQSNQPFRLNFAAPSQTTSVQYQLLGGAGFAQGTATNCISSGQQKSCTSDQITLPAGSYNLILSVNTASGTLSPITKNIDSVTVGGTQPVIGLNNYFCINDNPRVCRTDCTAFGGPVTSPMTLAQCQQLTGGQSGSLSAQNYRECTLPPPDGVGGKWCISRSQMGRVDARCVPVANNCPVGFQPSNGNENLCQEACQGQSYGFGGYGSSGSIYGSSPYGSPNAGGIPIGTCTSGSPLLFLGNVVGGNVAQQASLRPYPLTGSFLCSDRQETCWCTVFSVGTAFSTGSTGSGALGSGLFGSSPTIPGTTSTPHWTDPNAIDDPPKANPNEFVCDAVSDVGLRASVDSPGLNTEELKIFASGQQVTITGEVAKFSATCLGYKYQCERFQEFQCDFSSGFFKDSWKYQKFPGQSSGGVCPNSMPDVLEKRGAGSKWHVGRILTLIAMAVLVAASMGAFGPIFGTTLVTGTVPAGAAAGTAGATVGGVTYAAGATITAAGTITAGAATVSAATAAQIAAASALAALTIAPMLDGCGPNAAGLALLTQAGLNGGLGGTGTGSPISPRCDAVGGACLIQGLCTSGGGTSTSGRLDCPLNQVCCTGRATTGTGSGTQNSPACSAACIAQSYVSGFCEQFSRSSAFTISSGGLTQNQFGCTNNNICNCYRTPTPTGNVIGVAQAQSSGGNLGGLFSNPAVALSLMSQLAGPGLACNAQEQRVCFSVCGKKYDTAVAASPTCNQGGVVIGYNEANYPCSEGSCGGYAGKTVDIEVLDIDGTTLQTKTVTTKADGTFDFTITAPNTDGVITVVLTSDAPVSASTVP